MINDNTIKIIDELVESFFSRYQIGLERSMRRSGFIFDSVRLLNYRHYKINFKRDGSYIDSPD